MLASVEYNHSPTCTNGAFPTGHCMIWSSCSSILLMAARVSPIQSYAGLSPAL